MWQKVICHVIKDNLLVFQWEALFFTLDKTFSKAVGYLLPSYKALKAS